MSGLVKAAKGAVTGFVSGGPYGALAGAGLGLAGSLLAKKAGGKIPDAQQLPETPDIHEAGSPAALAAAAAERNARMVASHGRSATVLLKPNASATSNRFGVS